MLCFCICKHIYVYFWVCVFVCAWSELLSCACSKALIIVYILSGAEEHDWHDESGLFDAQSEARCSHNIVSNQLKLQPGICCCHCASAWWWRRWRSCCRIASTYARNTTAVKRDTSADWRHTIGTGNHLLL